MRLIHLMHASRTQTSECSNSTWFLWERKKWCLFYLCKWAIKPSNLSSFTVTGRRQRHVFQQSCYSSRGPNGCLHIDQNLDRSMDCQFYLMNMFMSHPFGHLFNGADYTFQTHKIPIKIIAHCLRAISMRLFIYDVFSVFFSFYDFLCSNSCWNFNSNKTNASSNGCVHEARALACKT